VNHHFDRYPAIDALVTEESVQRMDGVAVVHSSEISNVAITKAVNHDLAAIADNTLAHRVEHSAECATLAAGGRGLIDMLRGKKDFPQAVTESVKRVGVASAATAITAYLFS
jgi:hypothetical protein